MGTARELLRAEIAGWSDADRQKYAPLFTRLTAKQAEDVVAASLDDASSLKEFLELTFLPTEDGPMHQLQELLKPVYPNGLDVSLMARLKAHMPARIAQVSDMDEALVLVLEALCFPSSDDETLWEKQFGYVIGSPFPTEIPTNAVLLQLFENCQPRVLKIPTNAQSAKQELSIWSAVQGQNTDLIVPILRSLHFTPMFPEEGVSQMTGFVLPRYSCDASMLGKTPPTGQCMLNLVERMIQALALLHDVGFCHSCIIPQHIFIDFQGQPALGSLSHVYPTGHPFTDSCSLNLRPSEVTHSSALCDILQLAASALVVNGLPFPKDPLTAQEVKRLLRLGPAEEWKQQLLQAVWYTEKAFRA